MDTMTLAVVDLVVLAIVTWESNGSPLWKRVLGWFTSAKTPANGTYDLADLVAPLRPLETDDPTADELLFEAGKALVAEQRHEDAAVVFGLLTRRKPTTVSGDPLPEERPR